MVVRLVFLTIRSIFHTIPSLDCSIHYYQIICREKIGKKELTDPMKSKRSYTVPRLRLIITFGTSTTQSAKHFGFFLRCSDDIFSLICWFQNLLNKSVRKKKSYIPTASIVRARFDLSVQMSFGNSGTYNCINVD